MGLNCFDGKNIRQYHSGNRPHALRSEFAAQSRFQESPSGELWFTNNETLTHYLREPDHFEHFQFVAPGRTDTLNSMYFWSYLDTLSNYIWVSGGRHLFALNTKNTSDYKHIDSLYVRIKDRMYAFPDNRQYLFMCGFGNSNLRVREFREFRSYSDTTFPSPSAAAVNDVRYQSDDRIWVATDDGLFRFDLETGQWHTMSNIFDGRIIDDINEISFLNERELLVGTKTNGIYFFDLVEQHYTGQIYAFDNNRISPFKPNIVRMVVDRKNNLWVHSKDDGVYFTHLKKPKFRISLFGEERLSAKSISPRHSHGLWILDQTRALRIDQRDTTVYNLPISGVDLEQAISIFEDRLGRVWLGTLWELFVLFPGETEFKTINLLPKQLFAIKPYPGYNHFLQLSNGDLLFATNNKYVVRVSEDLRSSSVLQQVVSRPRHFISGPNKELLIATYEDSLHIGRLTTPQYYERDTSLTQIPFVSSACYDQSRQCYWVGTYNGLYKLQKRSPNAWTWTLESEAGSNIAVNSIELDERDRLWMTFPGGIRLYDPNGRVRKTYQRADGLQGLDYIMSASAKLSDGEILFGGTNGLTRFYPDEIRPTVPNSQPTVTAITINQEQGIAHKYSRTDTRNPGLIKDLRLPHDMNNLGFTLASLEYSAPDQCIFSYQLLGSTDTSVVVHGPNSQLNFPNLSPGSFTLMVWSTNSDGERSPAPYQINITVLPPWYRTTLFYFMCLLATLVAAFLFYRVRLRRLLHQEALKRAASEARQQLAETETAILRLQMDPHFIFNSMNAIDSLVLENETAKAHEYLICFAGLMRGILDNSANPYTCLDEEILLLERYLQSEQIRMGDRLSYNFEVHPDLDTFDLEIPTMILQPFVENAIWHGVAPKEEPGQITVRFYPQEEWLICEVQDDGVGRPFHQNRSHGYSSKATAITKSRLELLNNQNSGQSADFKLVDLKNVEGESEGTLVRFRFPSLA